jgi:CubicO group peptidase (beta-lactamase class C family)
MKSVRVLLAVVLLLPAAPLAAQQVAGDDVARVDRVFQRWTGEAVPGCAVGVARDGAPLLLRAWGMADLEHGVPNSPATIFEAGSVAKQFTAAAVLLLVQQGRLSLDDDVRTYVPELPDYGTTIRIRHLLNHTSGLRDWGGVAAIGGWSRSHRTHTHEHVLDILAGSAASTSSRAPSTRTATRATTWRPSSWTVWAARPSPSSRAGTSSSRWA